MSPSKLEVEDEPLVFDIRTDCDGLDMKAEIIKGLVALTPRLPQLLLWDDKGQQLFDDFSQTPTYYPFHSEMEILNRCGPEIVKGIQPGGILLELGCGTIRKTKTLLSRFSHQQKPIHYFALDVSRQGLQDSLVELKHAFRNSPWITFTGLLGTYDDGVAWLSGLRDAQWLQSVTVLWLGNSIANMDDRAQASAFLASFRMACQSAGLACHFIVSTDICQRNHKLLNAYDPKRSQLRAFILNSLDSANSTLGYPAFSVDDWMPVNRLDEQERTLRFYLACKRDLQVHLPVGPHADSTSVLLIPKGTEIPAITTGKWSEAMMEHLYHQAGFYIHQHWKDREGDYCVFLLRDRAAL